MTNNLFISQLLLLCGVLFSSFALQAADLAPEVIPVEVAPVNFKDYAKPLRVSGLLENKSEQTLAFKVSG